LATDSSVIAADGSAGPTAPRIPQALPLEREPLPKATDVLLLIAVGAARVATRERPAPSASRRA
jgi:hypothetical protein